MPVKTPINGRGRPWEYPPVKHVRIVTENFLYVEHMPAVSKGQGYMQWTVPVEMTCLIILLLPITCGVGHQFRRQAKLSSKYLQVLTSERGSFIFFITRPWSHLQCTHPMSWMFVHYDESA